MPDASHPRATYADIEALPSNMVGEILDGALVTQPRPRPFDDKNETASSNETAP